MQKKKKNLEGGRMGKVPGVYGKRVKLAIPPTVTVRGEGENGMEHSFRPKPRLLWDHAKVGSHRRR